MSTANDIRYIYQAFIGVDDMKDAYERAGLEPGSEEGNKFLIRSYLAYWQGSRAAEDAVIERLPSEIRLWHPLYKVLCQGIWAPMRIMNVFDHRNGVEGWCNQEEVS